MRYSPKMACAKDEDSMNCAHGIKTPYALGELGRKENRPKSHGSAKSLLKMSGTLLDKRVILTRQSNCRLRIRPMC